MEEDARSTAPSEECSGQDSSVSAAELLSRGLSEEHKDLPEEILTAIGRRGDEEVKCLPQEKLLELIALARGKPHADAWFKSVIRIVKKGVLPNGYLTDVVRDYFAEGEWLIVITLVCRCSSHNLTTPELLDLGVKCIQRIYHDIYNDEVLQQTEKHLLNINKRTYKKMKKQIQSLNLDNSTWKDVLGLLFNQDALVETIPRSLKERITYVTICNCLQDRMVSDRIAGSLDKLKWGDLVNTSNVLEKVLEIVSFLAPVSPTRSLSKLLEKCPSNIVESVLKAFTDGGRASNVAFRCAAYQISSGVKDSSKRPKWLKKKSIDVRQLSEVGPEWAFLHRYVHPGFWKTPKSYKTFFVDSVDSVSFTQVTAKLSSGSGVFTIDMESDPSGKGRLSDAVILQLGVEGYVWVFDIANPDVCKELDATLSKVLSEGQSRFKMTGSGMKHDIREISKVLPRTAQVIDSEKVELVELSTLYTQKYPIDESSLYGLEFLTLHCFHQTLNKLQQTSQWTRRPLWKEQIEYAIADAAVAMEIYRVLSSNKKQKKGCK